MTVEQEVPLVDAARGLGVSWGRAWRLMLIGELQGHKQGSRWVVTRESLDALRDRMKHGDAAHAGAALEGSI